MNFNIYIGRFFSDICKHWVKNEKNKLLSKKCFCAVRCIAKRRKCFSLIIWQILETIYMYMHVCRMYLIDTIKIRTSKLENLE